MGLFGKLLGAGATMATGGAAGPLVGGLVGAGTSALSGGGLGGMLSGGLTGAMGNMGGAASQMAPLVGAAGNKLTAPISTSQETPFGMDYTLTDLLKGKRQY